MNVSLSVKSGCVDAVSVKIQIPIFLSVRIAGLCVIIRHYHLFTLPSTS